MLSEKVKAKIERCKKYVNYPDPVWEGFVEKAGEQFLDDILKENGESVVDRVENAAALSVDNLYILRSDVIKMAAYVDFAHECMESSKNGAVNDAVIKVYKDLLKKYIHDKANESEGEFFARQGLFPGDCVNICGEYLNGDGSSAYKPYLDMLSKEGYFSVIDMSDEEIATVINTRFHFPKMLNYMKEEVKTENKLHSIPISFGSVIKTECGPESPEYSLYGELFKSYRAEFIKEFPQVAKYVPALSNELKKEK